MRTTSAHQRRKKPQLNQRLSSSLPTHPLGIIPNAPMMLMMKCSLLNSSLMGAQNFFNLSLILQFCFFHALGVLGYGEGIDHRLDVASEEALQVVGGIADTVVGHTALWEVVGTDLR